MAQGDQFLIGVFKRREDAKAEAASFLQAFERTLRTLGARINVNSDNPKKWESIDGREHHVEPNHLNPAAFDFDALVVASFRDDEELHRWWNSDEMFELLKHRTPIAKMGLFVVQGLQEGIDVSERNRMAVGDKFALFEFMKLKAFKPLQLYVDTYKKVAETARQDTGCHCNLVFAESIHGVLMNEYPLEAACCSLWRSRSDLRLYWYESEKYQKDLKPLREEYADCHTVVIPIMEDNLDNALKAAKEGSALTRLVKPRS